VLENCLKLLFEAANVLPVEVILFVDGIHDLRVMSLIKRLAKTHGAYVFQSAERLGSTGAYRAAAQHANGEFVAFMDSDVLLQPHTLPSMLKRLKSDNSIGMVQGLLLYPQTYRIQSAGHVFGNFWNRHALMGRRFDPALLPGVRYSTGLTTALAMLPSTVYQSVGGFDDFFFDAYDGLDLSLRVWQSGLKCVVEIEAPAYHIQGGSRARLARNEEQQIGYFWSQWGQQLQPDISDLYRSQLKNLNVAPSYSFINVSDFKPWIDLLAEAGLRLASTPIVEERYCSRAILYDLVSPQVARSLDPLVFICNHFSDIKAANRLWFDTRQHPADLIIDTHGNVVSPYATDD
jgi:GT2 family glycosyltransferase